MVQRKFMIPLLLAGGLFVLTACGRDDTGDLEVGDALYGLTVIDAVQLGAAQGCHSLASQVTGSLTINMLEESDDLVLLLEDGYPLCIDTMDTVAAELSLLEASYLDGAQGPPEGSMSTDDVEQMMLTPGEVEESDEGGVDETDPNPQPAVETGVGGQTTNPPPTATATLKPAGSPTSPPDTPPESSD
ncbi:MAG: hypothetical protein JRG91_04720 [Deltaproteobacteria bacterium]|nr:hypothetical protein [Deltaproteobacteria bacterium]